MPYTTPSPQTPVAFVTGAGSGLGEATARRLAVAGFHVIAAGRRLEPLDALAASLPPGTVRVCRLDLADTAAVVATVHDVVASFGRLDVIVNNAAMARQVPIAETSPELFAETLATNLAAPAAAISTAWPTFVRQGSGCIVNVSSLAQFDPFPGFFAYGASKAGLHLLTVVAKTEGAEHGIRAFTVAPGVMETAMHRALMPEGVPEEMRNSADDVAAVVAECVAGDHDELVGRTLAVVAAGVAPFVQEWIDTHEGGGITVVQR